VVTLVVGALTVGFGSGLLNAAVSTLVVTRSAEAVRGRVISALGGTVRSFSLVALLLGGLVGALLGPRNTFVAGGAGCLLATVAAGVLLLRSRLWVKDSVEEVLSH
jgi:MFS family permease